MYIAQLHIKVLAQRHIAIGVNHQFAEYALAAQFEISVSPFLIQCHKIEILFRVVYALRNVLDIILHVGGEQFGCGVEEVHRAINSDAHIYAIALSHANHIVHVGETVPRREAKHQ